MTYMFKYLLFIVFALCFTSTTYADKSNSFKPKWLTHKLPSNKSEGYMFVRVHGVGTTLDAARQNALVNLSSYLETNHGLKVSSSLKSHTTELLSENTSNHWSQKNEIILEVEEEGKLLNIDCRTIDEYWKCKKDTYSIDVLYTVSTPGNKMSSYKDNIIVTSKYGAKGLWRSAIVPGWGQFYKGDDLKGGLILGGCVIATAGLIFTESERADYDKKIGLTSNTQLKRDYINKRNNFETARNICIGVAAAIYVYNLIDAVTASGAARVEIKSRSNSSKFALSPMLMADGAAGFTAAITF